MTELRAALDQVQRAGAVTDANIATRRRRDYPAAVFFLAIAEPFGADMNRASMDRFIDTIEWIAAGFVGIVAAQHLPRACSCATR